jgi:hypothetical protein
MPTETPQRPSEVVSWSIQDLTSECDVQLDTVTADRQLEIRRVAIEIAQKQAPAAPPS